MPGEKPSDPGATAQKSKLKTAIEDYKGAVETAIESGVPVDSFTPTAKSVTVSNLDSYHVTDGDLERLRNSSTQPRLSGAVTLFFGATLGSVAGAVRACTDMWGNSKVYFPDKENLTTYNSQEMASFSMQMTGDMLNIAILLCFVAITVVLFVLNKAGKSSKSVEGILHEIEDRHKPKNEQDQEPIDD